MIKRLCFFSSVFFFGALAALGLGFPFLVFLMIAYIAGHMPIPD